MSPRILQRVADTAGPPSIVAKAAAFLLSAITTVLVAVTRLAHALGGDRPIGPYSTITIASVRPLRRARSNTR